MVHICLFVLFEFFNLTEFSELANVIIAAGNLIIVTFLTYYTLKKDKKTENKNALLNDQSIKLQWIKDLIIQPNINLIYDFYNNVEDNFCNTNFTKLTNEDKLKLSDIIKFEQLKLMRSFVDIISHINFSFHIELKNNIDDLIDVICEVIINTNLNLETQIIHKEEIRIKIKNSKGNFFSLLYNYK